MDVFIESQKYYNIPLIDSQFISKNHLIYLKYTSDKYFKYCAKLLDILCKNSLTDNPKYLFQLSLSYIIKILYNSGNTPCLNNLDLLILCSFILGMKVTDNQNKCLTITNIKNIYPERFEKYNSEEIKFGEVICIKTLQYNINILTPYECLLYLLEINYKMPLLKTASNILDKYFFDKRFIFSTPMQLAKDCIKPLKQQIIITKPIFSNRKNLTFIKSKNIIHSTKGNESISTGTSSYMSNANITKNNKENNITKSFINQKKFIFLNNVRYKKFSRDKFHSFKNSSNENFYSKYREVKIINNGSKSLNVSKGELNTITSTKKLDKFNTNSKLSIKNSNFKTIDYDEKNLIKKPEKKIFIESYDNLLNTLSYNEIKNKNKLNNRSAKDQTNQYSSINVDKNISSRLLKSNNTFINNSEFRKSTIIQNTNRCLNLVKKLKTKINKNEKQKKIISIWKCKPQKFMDFNYDKISDLCSKLNFDIINNISGDVEKNK